jgi:hypothetical protein
MKKLKFNAASLMMATLTTWCASENEAACTGANPTMRRHAMRWWLFLVPFVLLLCGEAGAASCEESPAGSGHWYPGSFAAQSLAAADVTSCISSASAGGTIHLTTGTVDWSGGGVTLNKALKVIGQTSGCPAACDDATKIQVGTVVAFTTTASNWRISGITFEGAGNTDGSIVANAGGATVTSGWRVDHCHFKDTTGRGISGGAYANITGYGKDFPALIDNNRFFAAARFKAVEVYGGSLTTHGEWDTTLVLGGGDFLFIEDNYFVHTTMPDGVSSIDGDTGARYVIRYNTFQNGDISAHGVETCSAIDATPVCVWRSTHGWEIYGNTFTYNTTHSFVVNIRGGTGVIHHNTVTGTVGTFKPARYVYERGDLTRTCLLAGACQGSSTYDGNQAGTYGYVCYQQIGATGSTGIVPKPVYHVGNVYNGSTVEANFTEATFEAGCNYQHVQIGRDVILVEPSAVGLYANLPATCNPSEGYWVTDQGFWDTTTASPSGQFFKCTAPNTWTLYYTPYTYPYRARPAPPTSLLVQ